MNYEEYNPSPSQRSQFRLGLRQLFFATALIASGAALSTFTILFSVVVLLVWWGVFSFRRFRIAMGWMLVGSLGLFTLFGWVLLCLFVLITSLPAVSEIQESPDDTLCLNRIRGISYIVQYYESENQRFPTDRIVTLTDGTELRHSWRIEILPLLGEQDLYDQYDFNEPWNGPNNSKLESLMPQSFAYPSHDTEITTPYRLVNGPGTAFEIGKNIRGTDLKDGSGNTIALIEDHANPSHWMEPSDCTAEEAAQVMNSMTKKAAAHSHESFFFDTYLGSSIAMADGSSHWWPPQQEQPVLPGAFLIDDGYRFDAEIIGKPFREIKYEVCSTLAIYLLLILLPAFFMDGLH